MIRLALSALFLLIAGCSQPLRTLMDLGQEQKAQQDFVATAEARLARLKKDVASGRLEPGALKKEVLARYGQPVLERGEEGKVWLYRDPVCFLGAEKTYLSFDARGRLEKIEVDAEVMENVVEGEDAGSR